jgi:hypothetical protein
MNRIKDGYHAPCTIEAQAARALVRQRGWMTNWLGDFRESIFCWTFWYSIVYVIYNQH